MATVNTSSAVSVTSRPASEVHSNIRPVSNKLDEYHPEEEEEEKDPDEKDLLHGMKLFLAFVAMLLSIFLVALDGVRSFLHF
jgi:hypothetical protein